MHPDSIEKTTFITHVGTFAWTVLPFGLVNAPPVCSRVIEKMFGGLTRKFCYIYLDDIIVYANSFDEHLERLILLFERMLEFGLKLSPEKCEFVMDSVKYLGHLVSAKGIHTDPDKIRAVAGIPSPTDTHKVKQFLGLCSFYRRFIMGFAIVAAPLNALLRKDVTWAWGEPEEMAFQELKRRLTEAPVLAHYSPEKPTELRTDACSYGIAGELIQYDENGLPHAVHYISRTLSSAETRYPITHLECLAIVYSVIKLRCYLHGIQFVIKTDHCALCYLMKVKDPCARLARWALRLQEFTFEIKYSSNKSHTDVDCLSRSPIPTETRR